MMVRQELVVEHSVEREAEGDAGAGAISVLVMRCRWGVLQSDD